MESKLSFSLQLLAFTLLTLTFGGVGVSTILSNIALLLFLLSAVMFLYRKNFLLPLTQRAPLYILAFLCYLSLLLYITLHPAVLSLFDVAPYTGEPLTSRVALPLLLGLYSLLTAWHLSLHGDGLNWLNKQIIRIGAFIAIVALSHWLVDNGKLFFLFKAEHSVITTRARWPFVNPNHLAAFLLIPLCLAMGKVEETIRKTSRTLRQASSHKNFHYSHYLGTREGQQIILNLIFSAAPLLVITVTLIASQSRNGFLCLALMMLFITARSFLSRSHTVQEPTVNRKKYNIVDTHELKYQEIANSNTTHKSKALSNFLFPMLLLLFSLSLFLLSPKGADLIRERATYSIAHTRDDIRFQLYRESIPLLTRSPILGIGGGNWSHLYPGVQQQALNGYRPRYLHSDPYQFVIEYGALALLPLLLILSLLVLSFRKSEVSSHSGKEMQKSYSLLAITILVIFSCFDFPFHIGGTAVLFAILLTSLFFYKDNLS